MAYETGTATGAIDLLQKYAAFAVAQGWTKLRDDGVGSGITISLQKGSAFFHFRAFQNESVPINGSTQTGRYGIAICGSDSFNGSLTYDQQPGAPLRVDISGGATRVAYTPFLHNTGPFTSYHFFAPDSKTLYAEIEIMAGVYERFGCGSLDLFNPGAPGGGRFFYGMCSTHPTLTGSPGYLNNNIDASGQQPEHVPFRTADYGSNFVLSGSFVRCAFGSFDNWAQSSRSTPSTAAACQGGGCHDKVLRDLSPSPLNGVGVLLPNIVSLNVNEEFLMPIGTMPGLRYMDMTMYDAQAEFNLGPDLWKVFPWYNKGGLSIQRGIAYAKVA